MNPLDQLGELAASTIRAAAAPRHVPGRMVRRARRLLGGSTAWALREVGERVDLTPLVTQIVDLDRLVAAVDIDAVARRLDVDAVVDRLDLVTIVESVIAEIDLPELIRESTGSMASDTLTGVRLQGISADEAVTRALSRLLPRTGRLPDAAAPAPA